ncbi:DUF4114 domain-containing protein [Anabaena sp. FACHB-709]|uniref:DUF4114 domain-containing protein n=2 Tax=Nostocaceae TaxID=1162 RepID=A0A1Z4KEB0_ANAVA|nr:MULTISPECIES: DUF4114 domain-containing protein [Nostocaceae]BAY67247.1 hypothetical protein NIES23_00190 [Trichormus variabilis NIES-23]HBW30429.1 DUF4114 domain-containing protein [Nostoc sp. UBA8866]MBD2173092.1 DUF4114 domain-containing protein [Anabaena cylindrica FACHB-318]MBD2264919.1 DUF4114 domain-containing protein [Anabaena sp. FACHB-709]MBD2274016.1 DUF4114 domain-containing protein [Nostoc sp. PCC 7120 = FACHB-418]
MTTISNLNNGIFTVSAAGNVSVDFLYDGGMNKGELAIFSLEGMENMAVGSIEFIREASRRALSNSQSGYVVVRDQTERARFTDLNQELSWEKDFNSGVYNGPQTFQMKAGSKFAMMLIADSTVSKIAQYPTSSNNILFSFGSVDSATGKVSPQIADITGKGNTFGWEDNNTLKSNDRDFNDMVVQVLGATANAPSLKDSTYSNRNWLNTGVGQELSDYANRPLFETGTFIVNGTGQVKLDYLYDGGAYQGQLAVFSLKGMEKYQPGSLAFIKEAATRALSNSTQGRILISDRQEGARFDGNVSWESNFNQGSYQGIDSFTMNAGDEVAFMLVQDTSIEEIYRQPQNSYVWGKQVIFSTDKNQIVAVDNKGTLAFEDMIVGSSNSYIDYNDVVFQVQGLKSNNITNMDAVVNPNQDWRTTAIGQEVLKYTNRTIYNEGVFQVGETGKVTVDYLYDGGGYQGHLAVFSLTGMENYIPGSNAFIKEATNRALSNSQMGYILARDQQEGARFTEKMPWEANFNFGPYLGVKTFQMKAGDTFAFMLVPNTTVQEINQTPGISKSSTAWQIGKLPLFSIPEANPSVAGGQMVDIDGNGTFAFEDIPIAASNSDRDYNDVVFQIKGAKGTVQSIDNFSNFERDWRTTTTGKQLLDYANRASFDEGVFTVDQTGQVKIDFLYDGGMYSQGEVGIFSLKGMDIYKAGSDAFIQEALRRATSNSANGYVVVKDAQDGALYSDNTGVLDWEANFNAGEYQGTKTYNLQAGDTIGFVFMSNGALTDALTGQTITNQNRPLFSMSAANLEDQVQVAGVLTGDKGAILGFDDVPLNRVPNRDFNDFVISIQGVQSLGISKIENVMAHNLNWVDTAIGQDIINHFQTGIVSSLTSPSVMTLV